MHHSFEAIGYQLTDKFGPALLDCVQGVCSEIDAGTYKTTNQIVKHSASVAKMLKLIRSRLGLNVLMEPDLHAISPAAISPFFGDYLRENQGASGFNAQELKSLFGAGIFKAIKRLNQMQKDKAKVIEKLHGRTGEIDFKHARVTGYLSEVRHYLIIDFILLRRWGMSEREITAIILHELGHGFDGLEQHYKLARTNRQIMDILNDLHEGKEDKALYRFHSRFTQKEFEQKSIASTKERSDFYGKIALAYASEVKSQMQDINYHHTAFEAAADGFAVRFGFGEAIATGLSKLYAQSGATHRKSAGVTCVFFLVDAIFALTFLLFFPVIGAIIFALSVLLLLGCAKEDMTYDDPVYRFTRIRTVLIGALKNQQLPKEAVQDCLAQYEVVDALVRDTDFYRGILPSLSDWIVPSNVREKHYIELQQMLEEGMNNTLFVKSAQVGIA